MLRLFGQQLEQLGLVLAAHRMLALDSCILLGCLDLLTHGTLDPLCARGMALPALQLLAMFNRLLVRITSSLIHSGRAERTTADHLCAATEEASQCG